MDFKVFPEEKLKSKEKLKKTKPKQQQNKTKQNKRYIQEMCNTKKQKNWWINKNKNKEKNKTKKATTKQNETQDISKKFVKMKNK